METCRTKPLVPEFSACLADHSECSHASRLGFNILCEHPDHRSFNCSVQSPDEQARINAHHRSLKRERRERFYSELKQAHADNHALVGLIEDIRLNNNAALPCSQGAV